MSENTRTQFRPPNDVGAQRLAKVYAEALLGSATQGNAVESVLEEFDSLINDVFAAEPLLEDMFCTPVVPAKVKEAGLERVFEGRASELFRNFLQVLNHHNRLDLLRLILKALHQLVDDRNRRIRVRVRSAVPLSDAHRARLEQAVRNNLKLEPVFDETVDPELLGGLIVRVKDWQFDGSVRSQLTKLRNQLIERSSHEIQSGRDRFRNQE
jgi:F-type H+-transporting ATPase subunit delta